MQYAYTGQSVVARTVGTVTEPGQRLEKNPIRGGASSSGNGIAVPPFIPPFTSGSIQDLLIRIATCLTSAFLCETRVQDQPLITVMPDPDAILPTEAAILDLIDVDLSSSFPTSEGEGCPPSIQLSALRTAGIGVFGRIAQAAWLLDQVLRGFEIPNPDTRLACLRRLDGELRMFLSDLVQQTSGKRGPSCQAVSLTIRYVTPPFFPHPRFVVPSS